MLVLSRKINERIQIGDNVEITVLNVAGGRVKLGIKAAPSISILRSEMAETRKQTAKSVPPRSDHWYTEGDLA